MTKTLYLTTKRFLRKNFFNLKYFTSICCSYNFRQYCTNYKQ